MSKINFILNGLHSFLCFGFIATRIFCSINLLPRTLLQRLATTFIVIVITLYCNKFLVIASIFSVVIDLFSSGVMCPNHLKYGHINS